MDNAVFKQRLSDDIALVNGWLDRYLPDDKKEIINIVDAMNYSVKVGGKRLRPILMYETFLLFGGAGASIERFACALECIHTYSLVHDDLPAMDNDLLRRGQPTTHAKYGEATGILAGDALLTYAFELALRMGDTFDEAQDASDSQNAARYLKAAGLMAEYAGYSGMIGGQILDLDAEGKSGLTAEAILRINLLKTSRLLQTAFCVGAILAGRTDSEIISDMNDLGENLGLAFQLQDDILDIEGDEVQLGKPIGSDDRNNKTTLASILGLDEAKKKAEDYTKKAVGIIDKYSHDDDFIKELIISLSARKS